jgi:hypothetical protein
MELPGTAFLYTLATLMVTFAGFSALLLIIRQTSGGQLSMLDRFLTRTLVGNLLMLTAGALLPPLLQLFDLTEAFIWKASALVFGLPYLACLLTFPRRRRLVTGRAASPFVNTTFIGLGSAALVAMMICVLAGFPHSNAIYIAAVTVNFFTIAMAFVIALEVILTQKIDRE